MISPEFEHLLRDGYSFRGNHIRIINFLGGKEVTAENIWTGTDVPRGRVYEFLDDLVDWGFIEIIPGKPRKFKLRNPRKALEIAVSKKEKELTQIQRRSLEIAKTLEWVESVEGSKFQILESSEEYYSRMREMVFAGNKFRVMVRKPLLVLASARQTAWKRRFYEAFIERIEDGLTVEYLFSFDRLMQAIEQKENRDQVLNELEIISEKIDLRFIPEGSTILTVAGNRVLFGFIDPAGNQVETSVYVESKEAGLSFNEAFDRVFERAKRVDKEVIQRLSMM